MESSIGVFVTPVYAPLRRDAPRHQSPILVSTLASTHSAPAHIFGSGIAGGLELLCFHPVDTVAKRLMAHEHNIFLASQSLAASKESVSMFPFFIAFIRCYF